MSQGATTVYNNYILPNMQQYEKHIQAIENKVADAAAGVKAKAGSVAASVTGKTGKDEWFQKKHLIDQTSQKKSKENALAMSSIIHLETACHFHYLRTVLIKAEKVLAYIPLFGP